MKTPVEKFIEQLEQAGCKVYKGDRYLYTVVNPKGLKGTIFYKPLEREIEIDFDTFNYISINLKKYETEIADSDIHKQTFKKEEIPDVFYIFARIYSNL